MKTVLILGAGFTRASRPKAKWIKRPPLDGDFFPIADRVQSNLSARIQRFVNAKLGLMGEEVLKSLEETASYLFIKAKDTSDDTNEHENYLNLLSLLQHTLGSTTNDIPIGPRSLPYRFLWKEIQRVNSPEDLTIITFNYDLLIERTLSSIDEHHSDLFSFPGCYRLEPDSIAGVTGVSNKDPFPSTAPKSKMDGVSVLKLHGSMNWNSSHTSRSPRPDALYNPRRNLHISNCTEIPPQLYRRRGRTTYLKPIIVPPVSGKKNVMHNAFSTLWAHASEALTEADRVVIVGYSCPDLDYEAKYLLAEGSKSNDAQNVIAIDPNAEVASKFAKICSAPQIRIFGTLNSYLQNAE